MVICKLQQGVLHHSPSQTSFQHKTITFMKLQRKMLQDKKIDMVFMQRNQSTYELVI